MNLPLFKKRALWIFVAAVVAIGGYFAHTAWQTQRGEAALNRPLKYRSTTPVAWASMATLIDEG